MTLGRPPSSAPGESGSDSRRAKNYWALDQVHLPADFTPIRFAPSLPSDSDSGDDHLGLGSSKPKAVAPSPNSTQPRVTIPHSGFPHLIDTILGYCSIKALANFRATNRAFHGRISRDLLSHVNLKSYAGVDLKADVHGEHHQFKCQKHHLFSLDAPGGTWGRGIPSRELALPSALEFVHTIDISYIRSDRAASWSLNPSDPLELKDFHGLRTVRRIDTEQTFNYDHVDTLVDFCPLPFALKAPNCSVDKQIIYLSRLLAYGIWHDAKDPFVKTVKEITIVIGEIPQHESFMPGEACFFLVGTVCKLVVAALEPILRGASVTVVGFDLLVCPKQSVDDDEDTGVLTVEERYISAFIRMLISDLSRRPGVDAGSVLGRINFEKSADWLATPQAQVLYPLPDYLDATSSY